MVDMLRYIQFMDFLPESVNKLIEELSKLPGIGPKSAQRLAFHILKKPASESRGLGEALLNVKEGVTYCRDCFALTDREICKICADDSRDRSTLCIVESTMDMLAIEKTGEYKGIYHVLHGKISPLDGVGPDDLKIAELFKRVTAENCQIRELIFGLNPDLEGDTTGFFIKEKINALRPIQMTRIARGVPSGGTVEYSDDITLIRALEGRQSL